jgi:hypothetical protein
LLKREVLTSINWKTAVKVFLIVLLLSLGANARSEASNEEARKKEEVIVDKVHSYIERRHEELPPFPKGSSFFFGFIAPSLWGWHIIRIHPLSSSLSGSFNFTQTKVFLTFGLASNSKCSGFKSGGKPTPSSILTRSLPLRES